MKARKINRIARRVSKQYNRGTYKGRIAVLSTNMSGALFVTYAGSILQPTSDNCKWANNTNVADLNPSHKHWLVNAHHLPVVVSYA